MPEFSPDGTQIVSGGGSRFQPGEIKLWDASSGEELWALRGHSKGVSSVRFSPDGVLIASAGGASAGTGTIKLWMPPVARNSGLTGEAAA